jgi:hypothetical protein
MGRKASNIIIILLCISIIVYSLAYSGCREGFQGASSIDVVVARYKENTEWLKEYDDGTFGRLFMYNKSDKPVEYRDGKASYIYKELPNVGVCDHTYLYHIIDNYDNLGDVTVFVPGSGSLASKKGNIDFVMEKVRVTRNTVFRVAPFPDRSVGEVLYSFTLDNWDVTSVENRDSDGKLELAKVRPFGKWYEAKFPGVKVKAPVYGGIFAVSRDHIRSREKSFYEELIKEVNTHKFHEASHYMERSWTSIFIGVPDECYYT